MSIIAANMGTYSGNWIALNDNVVNSPSGATGSYFVLSVVQGTGDSGYLIYNEIGGNGRWFTGVSGGKVQNWNRVPLDVNVLHATGDETSDGVKTFKKTIIGNISGNAGTANTLVVNDIADGTDLNSLRNAGNYSCGINKTSNTPVSGWFTLVVVQNGPYNGSQTLTNTNNGEVYIRTWINSGASFTDWHKLATSNEVVHSSGDENVKGKRSLKKLLTAISLAVLLLQHTLI
ncbi:pyocin knob domain-containing protein [Leuconostoc citreum]